MESQNLLPKDGTALYFPSLYSHDESRELVRILETTIEWKNDEVYLFGKHHTTKRKVAWYGDTDFAYTYSSRTKVALPWTSALKEIKSRVEDRCGIEFNSCLLNLYHDGDEGMGWHSDDEKTLGRNPPIASVSLGAPRKFYFRHKTDGAKLTVLLENGSLLLMKDETQHFWLHSLPKSKKVSFPRINLTFRNFKASPGKEI